MASSEVLLSCLYSQLQCAVARCSGAVQSAEELYAPTALCELVQAGYSWSTQLLQLSPLDLYFLGSIRILKVFFATFYEVFFLPKFV